MLYMATVILSFLLLGNGKYIMDVTEERCESAQAAHCPIFKLFEKIILMT